MGWKTIKNDVFIEVTRDYKEGSNERVYTRDLDSNQILDRRPVFRVGSRNLKYYVLNFEKVYDYNGLSKELKSLDNSITLNLSISYNFQFQKDPSNELLNLFFKLRGSQKQLNFLSDWIDEFSAGQPSFVIKYFERKEELLQYLTNKAQRLGLKLEIVIQEDKKNEVGYLQVSGQVVVRVKDYYGKIPLNYEIDLDIEPSKKSKATLALAAKDGLKDKIERCIKRTVQNEKNLSLHSMSFETSSTVRELVELALVELLKEDGLLLSFCTLEIDLKKPKTRVQLNLKVDCITRNKHTISVDHALILTLMDYGVFLSSGVKDIEKWAKEELERVTQDYTFERNFTDLIINFDDELIKNKMREETQAIGFEIKQLILIPNLEKIIPNYVSFDTADYEFSLKMNDMKVKLNIIFNARIKDLSKISILISPKSNAHTIVKRIKDFVVNEVSLFMHDIEPDDFYKYFDRPNEVGDIPIAEQLKNKVQQKTQNQFGLEVSDIICKSPDTELIRSFNKLIGHSTVLEIKNKTETIDFKIPFDVINVDRNGWFIFKAKISALNGASVLDLLKNIKDRMEKFVVYRIENKLSHDFSRVKSSEFIKAFLVTLIKGVEVIREDFGLTIKLSESWVRGASQSELAFIERMKIQREYEKQLELEQAKYHNEIMKAKYEGELRRAKAIMNAKNSNADDLLDDPDEVNQAYDEVLKKLPDPTDLREDIENMNSQGGIGESNSSEKSQSTKKKKTKNKKS